MSFQLVTLSFRKVLLPIPPLEWSHENSADYGESPTVGVKLLYLGGASMLTEKEGRQVQWGRRTIAGEEDIRLLMGQY
jgi:hypothetical protein